MILQKLRQRLADDQRGFTLIELLIVIVIIGILIAIAVPSYLGFRDRANVKSSAANVRAAVPAVETYFADNGTYVGMDMTDLRAIDAGVATLTITGLSATDYCISNTVNGKTAKKEGPDAAVAQDTTACA